MSALVTLEQVKAHLRVVVPTFDDDIALKADEATTIILDYLKARANRGVTIVTSSVASPTVITTLTPHGYANGDTATIAGHLGATPELIGSYVVSAVTTRTFTIPVAVTVAGAGGTATVPWTVETVPAHVQTAIKGVTEDLFEHRPIDWDFVERLLERSRDPAFA